MRSTAGRGVVDEHAQRQREEIVRALTDTKGGVAGEDGAAARLGLNRKTLLSRLKKLAITPSSFPDLHLSSSLIEQRMVQRDRLNPQQH
jgi:transcriptional regulator with GAF, ATPase, and Fis domain